MENIQSAYNSRIIPLYVKEIFGNRLCFALLCYYILQMTLYSSLTAFSINPFRWILNSWQNFERPLFYVEVILLSFVNLLAITEACLKYFYYRPHCTCRLTRIKNRLYSLVFRSSVGFLIGHTFALNINVRSTTEMDNFFEIVGVWTMICLPNSTDNSSQIIFPSLELRKLIFDIFDVFRSLTRSCILSLKIYLKLLIILPFAWLIAYNLLAVHYHPVDIYLLLRGWLLSVFVVMSKLMLYSILDFMLIQQFHFNINVDVRHDYIYNPFTLLNAITSNVPALRYLGYYDLMRISKDKNRIRELFTLTRPGCIPFTWNRICDELMLFIKSFTEDLKRINKTRPINNLETIFKIYNVHHNVVNALSKQQLLNNRESIYWNTTYPSVLYRWLNFLSKFKSYFFDELLENNLDEILVNNIQCLSLACESLSNTACLSMTEDLYGVVQERLPEIVHCLFELKNELQQLDMLTVRTGIRLHNSLLKNSLKYSVNSSLYLLAIKFRPYAASLHLSPEDEQEFRYI